MTTSTNETGKKPTHYARYKLAGTEDDFRQIGAAWKREDDSIYLKLDGAPLGDWDGTLWLFPPKSKAQEAGQ